MVMKFLKSFLIKKRKIRGDTMEYTLEELNKMMKDKDGNLDLYNTQIKSLPGDLKVGGSLDLSNTQIKSLPGDLKVGGNLDLEGTQITSLPEGLTVGGWLDLRHTQITSLPGDLKVRGNLYLSNTPIKSLPRDLKVGGSLDLSNTPITSLPEGLKIGGILYLSNTPIKSLPKRLTVGSWLYFRDTKIKSLPRDLKVGGNVSSDLPKNKVKYIQIQQGEYSEADYLYADGILTHIKAKKYFDKYTYFIGEFKDKNVLYDGTYYAHCENIKQGIEDLNFKHAKDRGSDQYRNLKLSSTLSFEESKTMYRVLTGACRQGTESFINNLKIIKEQYTIQELIDLTVNQYGHEVFKKFFR